MRNAKMRAAFLVLAGLMGAVGCRTKTEPQMQSVETAAESDSPSEEKMAGEEAVAFFDAMYEKIDPDQMPLVSSTELDLGDLEMLAYHMGLESADGIESVVISEPMMSSIAYSLIYVTPEEGMDGGQLLEMVMDGVNPSKWVCVTADDVRGVTFDENVFVMMVNSDLGESLYQAAVETAEELGMKVGNLIRK